MEMYTQTSNCGCSRKNSVMSFSAKNNRHHRLSSTGLRPLHFVDDDSRSLSMASLQIKSMRAQTSLQGARRDSKHYGKSGSKDASDYVNVGRGVAQTRSDYPTGARVGFVEVDDEQSTDSFDLGAHREYATQNHANVSSHKLELTPRSYALSRKTPHRGFTSPSKTHRTQHYQGGAVSRTVSDMVTHGHFVSRKPVQCPRTHSEMHQQGRWAGRERCRSGFAPSATLNQGGKGTMSATQARREKSAGDRYCGRPCDACTVQDLIKKEQLLDYELGENYKGMYIMDASGWRRVQIPSQEEVPMTTVSVPGQGLPMLTGLKHELADPSFYDRHREETAAPAHYIASPDCADRFFFENKRSMITLDVKAPPPPDPYFSSRLLRQRLPPRLAGQFPLGVYPTVAEMEAYSRMKQNHRPSRREPRVSGTPKPVTVVRKPDMLKHIRLGWQTMQQRKRGEMPAMAAYHDLFENILLYDVPGTSKMQNDYSGLMERTDSIDTLCSNMTLPDTMNLNQSNPR